jgi:hypothetical protein
MSLLSRVKGVAALTVFGLLAGTFGLVPAVADHNADDHSKNVTQLARVPIQISKDLLARGSDLAFQGNLIVAGTYEGTALYKITKGKPYIRQIGFHPCPASQGDVSVWGDLAFVSIDSASSNNGSGAGCNDTTVKGPGDVTHENSEGLEGIRVIDISNPQQIRQVGFVETDCGSHTHTLVPAGKKIYLYIQSYPLGAPTGTCNPVSHRKVSVVEIDRGKPTNSDVVGTLDVSPSIGCHDVTVFPPKKLAVAACITDSQIWSIKNPKKPEVIAHIPHPPGMQVAHSSAFTWDGKYVILSDEYGGAGGGGGCTGDEDSRIGAMFFYNIKDPENPSLEGHHSLPRIPPAQDEPERTFRCTTHNYNILPVKGKKYLAAASYYMGGMSLIDFTKPAEATEVAHYMPLENGLPDMWSAYWYNGRIYTNENESRGGVSVFTVKGTSAKEVRYFKGRMNPQTQIPNFK